MGQISLQIPQSGQPNSSEDPKVATDLTTIQTWANGNIDSTNVSTALAQSAGVNKTGQKVKGMTVIASAQSVTSTTYTTLATPDQVTGIVLPTNGYLRIWFQAQWWESVAGAARAAIFLGANQAVMALASQPSPVQVAAATGAGLANIIVPLASCPFGLVSTHNNGATYLGDSTTGQIVGLLNYPTGGSESALEINGTVYTVTNTFGVYGGLCVISAAAGTYTVSVRYKASSGVVNAQNRKLSVEAVSLV